MSHPSSPQSLSALSQFTFEKIINEDPSAHSLILLGTLPDPESGTNVKAIVRIEKTALNADDAPNFFGENGLINRIQLGLATDIVSPFHHKRLLS